MPLRLMAGAAACAVVLTGFSPVVPTSAEPAPRAKHARSTWAEADKTGFGTARATRSNVWFTLQRGRVSEVFYPDLSTPSVRSLELRVSGEDFSDRLSTDATTVTSRPDPRSLRYTQVATDDDGRYRVVQQYVTDPTHDTLVVRVGLESLDGGDYRLTLRYQPALDNGSRDDRDA